jgi:hypothetical protein
MRKMAYINRISVEKPEEKKPAGIPGRRWENNFKTALKVFYVVCTVHLTLLIICISWLT